MRKKEKNLQDFEDIISESLRFHGLLTPSSESMTKQEDVKLPEHLQEPDFLFKKEASDLLPKMRIAAFKTGAKKKK